MCQSVGGQKNEKKRKKKTRKTKQKNSECFKDNKTV